MTRDTLAGAGFEELKLRFYGKLIELEMREGDTLALCRAHLAKANTPSLLTLEDGRWQVCYYLFLEKILLVSLLVSSLLIIKYQH